MSPIFTTKWRVIRGPKKRNQNSDSVNNEVALELATQKGLWTRVFCVKYVTKINLRMGWEYRKKSLCVLPRGLASVEWLAKSSVKVSESRSREILADVVGDSLKTVFVVFSWASDAVFQIWATIISPQFISKNSNDASIKALRCLLRAISECFVIYNFEEGTRWVYPLSSSLIGYIRRKGDRTKFDKNWCKKQEIIYLIWYWKWLI